MMNDSNDLRRLLDEQRCISMEFWDLNQNSGKQFLHYLSLRRLYSQAIGLKQRIVMLISQ